MSFSTVRNLHAAAKSIDHRHWHHPLSILILLQSPIDRHLQVNNSHPGTWLIPAAYISSAWTNTQALIMIESERVYRNKISKVSKYYISSLPSNVKKVIEAVRSHWSVENQLHWYLDVVFEEDRSRIQKDNGVENFGTLRRLALGLLKRTIYMLKFLTAVALKCFSMP
jgi:predicted transposase YbfD/YdcC